MVGANRANVAVWKGSITKTVTRCAVSRTVRNRVRWAAVSEMIRVSVSHATSSSSSTSVGQSVVKSA